MPVKHRILEGGMDYKQLGMSNQDAEWLASRRFTIEDIARMFNVSPSSCRNTATAPTAILVRRAAPSYHDNAPVAGEL